MLIIPGSRAGTTIQIRDCRLEVAGNLQVRGNKHHIGELEELVLIHPHVINDET